MQILGMQKTSLLDFPGHVATTLFTGGCNMRCPYCHNGDLVDNPASLPAYTTDEIFDHLKKRKNILSGVAITGGEPTLHADLADFIKDIKELGYPVKLDTNGTNPAVLSSLIENGLIDYVAMDIKHSKDKYMEVVCHPFSIDDIQSSIDILMKNNIPYEFRTTICKEIHDETTIRSIGEWISGASQYFLQSYKESDNVRNPIYSAHSKETLLSYVDLLSKTIDHVEIRGID